MQSPGGGGQHRASRRASNTDETLSVKFGRVECNVYRTWVVQMYLRIAVHSVYTY